MKKENKTKGIWIPLNLWLNSELNLMEKIMFSQIKSLDNSPRGCFASNSYFSELLDVTKGRCSQIITSLKNKGYLRIPVILEGKQVKERNIKVVNKLNTPYRILKGVFNLVTRGSYNIKGGCLENAQGNSIVNNSIFNSIDYNNIKEFKKTDFDFLLKSKEFNNYLKEEKLKLEKINDTPRFNFRKELEKLNIDNQIINDWLLVRKNKKASNTQTSFNSIKKQIELSGKSANECIKIAVEKDWKSFKADWLANLQTSFTAPKKSHVVNLEEYKRKALDPNRNKF